MWNVFKTPVSPKGSAPPGGGGLYPTVATAHDHGIVIESKDDGSKYLDVGASKLAAGDTPSIYPSLDRPDTTVVRLARDGGGSGAYPVVVAWKPGQETGKESVSAAAVAPVTTEAEPAYVASHVANVAALNAAKIVAANEEEEVKDGEVDPQLAASEEVLVSVPGVTEVHLVAGQQNVLIGKGEFKLTRISQGNTGLMVLGKVGNDLSWPLLGTEPIAKINDRRYVVTVLVPRDAGDGEDEVESSNGSKSKKEKVKSWFSWSSSKSRRAAKAEGPKEADLLSYGITFPADTNPAFIAKLDEQLKLYSQFTVQPKMGVTWNERAVSLSELAARKFDDGTQAGSEPAPAPAQLPVSPSGRERTEDFWVTVAPNVDEYNSTAAKQIAKTTGYVIKAVIGLSDSAASTIESGGSYVKSKTSAATKESPVSPFLLRTVRRVRKFSKVTDDVASATLSGIIRVTGFFTGAVLKSALGHSVIKMLPGEVVLVSLDAFGKLLDALELSTKNVMQTSSVVTSDVVSHKYGSQAGEVTSETLQTGGHVLHTAWTISKIRNVLNPKAAATSASGVTGAVVTTVATAHKVQDIRRAASVTVARSRSQRTTVVVV